MKIIKFKKTSKGKYKVIFDNGDSISLYEEVIINNNLLFNKEVDDDVLKALTKQNNDRHAYNMALNYISIRLRSKREVIDYLKKKEVSQDVIDKVVERLTKEQYINDFNYVKAYVNDQLALTNYGPLKVKNNLLKQGINEEIINEVLEEYDSEIIKEKLYNLMEKQLRIRKGSSSMLKIKLLNYFNNLGYKKEDILNCISNFKIKTDIDSLKKEYDKLYNKYKRKYEGKKLQYFILQKLYLKGYSKDEILKLKPEE